MSKICDDLRKSILRAAIQGNLTTHDDSSIKELLDRNNIKYNEEKGYSFDIPETWAWVKLKTVANVLYGFPFNSQLFNKDKKGIPLIRIRDILPAKSQTYTTETASENYLVKKGDMLVGMDGNFNVNFWNSEDAYLNQRCCKITANNLLDQQLLFWFLPVFLDDIFENVSYTTVKHLSDKHLSKMSIPLPPLSEQKRIVEKVDELMARVADLEESADALASLKEAFPDDIKASLLQYAMQSKLTKQLPEDGDAADLLEVIKAKREKLIAEGKIKKQKALAPITDDEIPFSIPENWKWVRLSELFQFINGDRGKNYPSKSKLHTSGEIPFISAINMQNGTVREDNLLYADRSTYDKLGSGKLNKSDFVICIRGSLGKYCKYPYKIGAIASSLVIARKYSESIIDDYFDMYLQSSLFYNEIHAKDNGTAQPNLSAADLANFLIPLPPIATQRYIAERLKILIQNINVVRELTASE